MGIDGMRIGGGRCPPLIVGGLLLACFLLVCNWWSLSTENTELLRQIDEISQHLKISAEERDQCVTLRSKLEQRYKKTEDEVARLHVQLEEEKESQKTKEEAVTMCRSELDSLNKLDVTRTATLDTLRLEKETINGQLEEKKKENDKLQREFEKVQEELNQLKLTINAPGGNRKASPAEVLPVVPRTVNQTDPQLAPVPVSAVKVSALGQQGLRFHGIPILPLDPPDAEYSLPEPSITMLKDDAVVDNGTVPGGDQETQNALDAAPNNDNNEGIGGEISDNPEDEEAAAQDGIKNQGMKSPVDTERIQ